MTTESAKSRDEGDVNAQVFVRPLERPVITTKGRDIRVASGKYWVDFRNGEVIVKEDPDAKYSH